MLHSVQHDTNPIIAIDGPTASGKGTLARKLASHYGFDWLDTGLLYRAVGLAMLDAGLDPADAEKAATTAQRLRHGALDLDDERLRLETSGEAASKVASVPAVRAALLALQHEFAASPPGGRGAVLDGRDIGTVVCPQAPVKLYVVADVEIRAQRRFKELQGRGITVIYDAVLQDLKQRDARDSGREVAPLKPADDALLLDVSRLDAEQAFAAALALVEPIIGSHR
jgi:cytidylate kinase